MDCDSMQLFRDNDSKSCLLLLRKVEKISGYQNHNPGTVCGISPSTSQRAWCIETGYRISWDHKSDNPNEVTTKRDEGVNI
jgi:hypothetical protein